MPEVMMYQVMAPDWPVFCAASSSNLQEKKFLLTKTTEQNSDKKKPEASLTKNWLKKDERIPTRTAIKNPFKNQLIRNRFYAYLA
jgi:hypothetical protein